MCPAPDRFGVFGENRYPNFLLIPPISKERDPLMVDSKNLKIHLSMEMQGKHHSETLEIPEDHLTNPRHRVSVETVVSLNTRNMTKRVLACLMKE